VSWLWTILKKALGKKYRFGCLDFCIDPELSDRLALGENPIVGALSLGNTPCPANVGSGARGANHFSSFFQVHPYLRMNSCGGAD
ncbi:MAG: hypothetical protein MUC98_16370, partial [Desulfobacterota bacterium]|nr:hypothetical protein [Thermodesulfobacteriota bacterium]